MQRIAQAGGAAIGGLALLVGGLAPAHTATGAAMSIPACSGAPASDAARLAAAVPVGQAETPPPPITASDAVVIDGETGRVLYDLNAHDRRPPASTTKIMTALLALEHGDLNRSMVTDLDSRRLVGSSVMGLRPGVPITLNDLLYGLMLPSGNDAAIEIAKMVGGDEASFVDLMNQKAQELGLADTHFMNPHGLDNPEHYSSAYDLAWLARYAMGDPRFAQLVATQDYLVSPPWNYRLHNGNSMLEKYPGADGVKIGWTEVAGWTLVASAVRDGHRLYVTVLHSQDRDADASALFDWAFGSYQWLDVSPQIADALRLAQRLGFGGRIVQSFTVCG